MRLLLITVSFFVVNSAFAATTTAVVTTTVPRVSIAAVPFESYFGNYKIAGCNYSVNGNSVANDPECNYQHLQVGKNAKGVVFVTRSTTNGSSIGEPVETFDNIQGKIRDSAQFSNYGDFQVWTHTLVLPEGQIGQSRETKTFIFNQIQGKKLTFSVVMRIENRRGKGESDRVFDLVQE